MGDSDNNLVSNMYIDCCFCHPLKTQGLSAHFSNSTITIKIVQDFLTAKKMVRPNVKKYSVVTLAARLLLHKLMMELYIVHTLDWLNFISVLSVSDLQEDCSPYKNADAHNGKCSAKKFGFNKVSLSFRFQLVLYAICIYLLQNSFSGHAHALASMLCVMGINGILIRMI